LHLTAGQIIVLVIILIVAAPILLKLLGPWFLLALLSGGMGRGGSGGWGGGGFGGGGGGFGVLVEVPRVGVERAEAGRHCRFSILIVD